MCDDTALNVHEWTWGDGALMESQRGICRKQYCHLQFGFGAQNLQLAF